MHEVLMDANASDYRKQGSIKYERHVSKLETHEVEWIVKSGATFSIRDVNLLSWFLFSHRVGNS